MQGWWFPPHFPKTLLCGGLCRSWRMTADYRKLNPVEIPIAAILPDVISKFEQITTYLGTLYAAVDLVNAFISIPLQRDHQKKFFYWQGQKRAFTSLPQGCINSSALCKFYLAGNPLTSNYHTDP